MRCAPLFLPVFLLLLVACRPGVAADDIVLQRVAARISESAGPWCGRSSELRADGRRVCTLSVVLLEDRGAVEQASQLLDLVGVTRSLLSVLDEDQLAVVVGHEFAHLVLGHGQLRARAMQAGGDRAPAALQYLLEAVGNAPHDQAPIDPRDQEQDADALGLLFAMRAGYAARAGESLFGSALLRAAKWTHSGGLTHPASAKRSLALRDLAMSLCVDVARQRPLMLNDDRLLPLSEYRREEAASALVPPADCSGVPSASR